jgi:hypothetical protein
MAEKTLKSRIIHKHDTAANWLKATTFVPKQGEIIVYDIDADYSYERFKIGDGKTTVNSLPFAGGDIAANTLESAKAYTDAEIAEWVGDKTVSAQVQTAMDTKADVGHVHDDKYYTKSEVNTKLDGKSDKSHTHDLSKESVNYAATAGVASSVEWLNVQNRPDTYTPATHKHTTNDITDLQGKLDVKVPTSRKVNNKQLTGDITLSASDVGADTAGSASAALTNAKTYTNQQITSWVGDKTVAVQIDEAIDDAMEYVEGQMIEPVFYVTFTKQSSGKYTADKTYADVSAAYAADQTVMGLLNLGTGTIYHIPVLYFDANYGIVFHTSLESSEPITIGYGKDGTIVSSVYDKLASTKDISDAISKITHPVTSVNGQTGKVTLTASSVGADAAGSATSALNSAKSYTDTKISSMVGDTTVSTQITNALASKADAKHNHKIADITDIGDASVNYAVSAGGVAWANVSGKPSEYTPAIHSHAIADVTDLQKTLNAKVPTTRTVNGKALSADITLSASDVGADASGSANTALNNAKVYTDAEIAEWVGDKTVSAQISAAVATKADAGHAHDDKYYTETEVDSKLNGKLSLSGGTLTGNLTMDNSATKQSGEPYIQWATVSGNKPYTGFAHDQNDGTFVICSMEKDTTTNGVKHYRNGLAIGGGSGNLLWKGSKIVTVSDEASTSTAGLMSATDKAKLNGIATGATKVIVDSALSSTSTNPVQNKIVNAEISSIKTLVGDTAVATQISNAVANKADAGHTHNDLYYTESEINTKLSGKSDTSHTHSAYVNQNAFSNVKVGSTTIAADSTTDTLTLAGSNVTITPDATNDKVTIGITKANVIEALGYTPPESDTKVTVDSALSSTSTNPVQNKVVNAAISDLKTKVGDTSVITQIENAIASKSDAGHTHNYAGSSSAGGAATSANKLNTNDGSATQPVYFANGIPVKTTYTLGASVPSDAKFTDTVYTHPTSAGYKHIPSGGSTGKILKWSASGTATWADEKTYSNASTTAAGLMSATDKSNLDAVVSRVGDTAVATQISNAIANKSNTGHKHVIADITNIVISATQPSSPTAGMLWFDIS